MQSDQAWPQVSTDDVPPSRRGTYWKRQIARTLLALDLADVAEGGLSASQTIADLGSLRVVCVKSNAHVVERPQRLVMRHAKDAVFLSIMLEGTAFFYQGSSCATLAPGDMVFYDPSRTFIYGFTTAMRQVTVDFPAASFADRFGGWRERNAVRLDGRIGAGAHVSTRLTRHIDGLFGGVGRGSDQGGLPDAIKASRAAAIWDTTGEALAAAFPGQHLSMAERDSLARIKAFARERIGEPDLDLALVAAELGVSTRLVQRRFERTGTSFSEWLRVERLERAARALADPAKIKSSITTIAFDNAFVDSAHFSRAFKTRFGVSPSDWRQRTARGPV